MAGTVTFNGTVVATGETLTNWFEDGALPAPELQTDVVVQGLNAISTQSSNKDGVMGYDYSPTGSFDFTGAMLGAHIFMWINVTTKGIMDILTATPGGLGIRIYSGTLMTDWVEYTIAGGDPGEYDIIKYGTNGYTLIVIDPTKVPTRSSGTFDLTAVNKFGVWIATRGAARADNMFIDAIGVGYGLQITGISSDIANGGGWGDLLLADAGTGTNTWGIMQSTAGSEILVSGQIKIGDDTGSLATTFEDSGKAIKFISQQYYATDGSIAGNLVADDFFKIEIVDNVTNPTVFTDGVLVGLDKGRSGSKFVGSDLHTTEFTAGALSHIDSRVKLYNTTLEKMYAGITFHNNANSEFYSGTVNISEQFNANGTAKLRNITFSGYSGILAALLWNDNIDIKYCNFIANTDLTNDPSAIEMRDSTGDPYGYLSLGFSGNDYDIINTSGVPLTVNLDSSDASTYSPAGSLVTIVNTIALSLTELPNGIEVRLRRGSYTLLHVPEVTSNKIDYLYSYVGDIPIKAAFAGSGIIESTTRELVLRSYGQVIPLKLDPDPSYSV